MLEKTSLGNSNYLRYLQIEIVKQKQTVNGLRGQLKMAEDHLEWLEDELQDFEK